VATTTKFTLNSVVYGAEQLALFHVTVTAASGTPTGTVAIKNGSSTLCTFTLVAGAGGCTLSPTQLNAGSYSITAVYTPSSSNFLGSSATKTLCICQAATVVTLAQAKVTVGKASVQVAMSATLRSVVTGQGIAGQTITFTVSTSSGLVSCTAVTNASGVAGCTVALTAKQWASACSVTATYAGGIDYLASWAAQPVKH